MTLVLTELTEAGLAMAADSAISRLDPQGNIKEVDENGWQKLLRVPRIKAAVSYWGTIGAVTNERFDLWLNRTINEGVYSDLSSFADYLARALNSACQDKPLSEDCPVGIHVAGFAPWPDGNRRPTLYHVHNGHLGYHEWPEYENIGENQRLVKINVWPSSDPRKLFEKHADFPELGKSLDENFISLTKGYITSNGAFYFYYVIWKYFGEAIFRLNLVPGVSIPRNKSIGARKGFVHLMLQTMVNLYRCSNQSHIIGGEVTSLGIDHDGYLP